jgi:pyruvate kinase
MKKTKIICTIGPASEDKDTLKKLMEAGMNGARFNFSHGTHDEQRKKMDLVKEVRVELNLPIPIILDTKGPEIRTGDFEGGIAQLSEGEDFTICFDGRVGNERSCSVSYNELVDDVKPGDKILIDDGLIELTVDAVRDSKIHATIDNGGTVKDKKGINVPGGHVNLPSITESDKKDIIFGIEQGVDFIAASFIRTGEDVKYLRKFLDDNGGKEVGIISKIENKEGIDHIDEIIEGSDGIMVARGDMGVEIPAYDVPLVQKRIIKKCNRGGRFVITATQMLDSMMRNPRPTRAEVADVANAILDGSDTVMLSGETAAGKYPLESLEMMVSIASAVEKGIDYRGKLRKRQRDLDNTVTNAIGYATCSSAESLDAKAIITPTASGYTARVISGFRPECPIFSFTPKANVMRRLALVWGVIPYYHPQIEIMEEFMSNVMEETKKEGLLKDGDLVIVTAGLPLGIGGKTNMMRIHSVGE